MSKNFSDRRGSRGASTLVLLGAFASVACGSTDGTVLLHPAGGASGVETPAPAGAGGSGGKAGVAEPADAGADAAPDATPPRRSCVVGPLERYCALGAGYCPATYAEARAKAREPVFRLQSLLILQQACSAPDGSARVRVSALYFSLSRSYIFDPTTEQLVSVQIYDDLGGCADGASSYGFGDIRGFYGEDLPGCSLGYSSADAPAACLLPADWRYLDLDLPRDAGSDAAADAGPLENGPPFECILSP